MRIFICLWRSSTLMRISRISQIMRIKVWNFWCSSSAKNQGWSCPRTLFLFRMCIRAIKTTYTFSNLLMNLGPPKKCTKKNCNNLKNRSRASIKSSKATLVAVNHTQRSISKHIQSSSTRLRSSWKQSLFLYRQNPCLERLLPIKGKQNSIKISSLKLPNS